MKKTAGISLMLLIFLSLCLITFSLLSLSGATADAKLAQNSAERTTEYYAAVTEANEILNEIDTQLAAAWREVQTGSDNEDADRNAAAAIGAYADACSKIAASDEALTWTAKSKEELSSEGADSTVIGTLQYEVSVKEEQLLFVELSVLWPESGSDTFYQIISWQIVSTADWSADTSQNLYRTGTAG
ncbi:MAG: hypothetical protein LUG56_09280 [Lachnospiraceae bacterium]|nr:hypothetical protein [Lachnospiraceae bacterium]